MRKSDSSFAINVWEFFPKFSKIGGGGGALKFIIGGGGGALKFVIGGASGTGEVGGPDGPGETFITDPETLKLFELFLSMKYLKINFLS